MINLEITNYAHKFPEEHYRLFLNSWEEYFATGAQTKIPRKTFDNLYTENPFGDAHFATARDQDLLVGSLAAIPFTVAINDNRSFTAYQISVIMVSPQYRRQGIFGRMLRLLTEHLSEIPDALSFVFPNDRSRPGSSQNGYLQRATLPTSIHFPSPFWGLSSCSRDGFVVTRPGERKFQCREISIETARKILIDYNPSFPHISKDGEYLKWRYFQPGDSDSFHFHHLSGQSGEDDILMTSSEHCYGKRVFTVLLEVFNLRYPGEEPSFLPALLMKLSPRQGFPLLYTNESNLKSSIFSPTWNISLPHFVNPRPIDLLVHASPKNKELEKSFLRLDFATADWLGFL